MSAGKTSTETIPVPANNNKTGESSALSDEDLDRVTGGGGGHESEVDSAGDDSPTN